jgi:hypothetical protein
MKGNTLQDMLQFVTSAAVVFYVNFHKHPIRLARKEEKKIGAGCS